MCLEKYAFYIDYIGNITDNNLYINNAIFNDKFHYEKY